MIASLPVQADTLPAGSSPGLELVVQYLRRRRLYFRRPCSLVVRSMHTSPLRAVQCVLLTCFLSPFPSDASSRVRRSSSKVRSKRL